MYVLSIVIGIFSFVIFSMLCVVCSKSDTENNKNNNSNESKESKESLDKLVYKIKKMDLAQILNLTVDFGKHEGKIWKQVPTEYLEWMLKQDDHHRKIFALRILDLNY